MHEDHAKEQYFFDSPTVARLAGFVLTFEHPALLCCPMVGRALHERGVPVPVLDVDERFSDLPGFIRWDVYRPVPVPDWTKPDLLLIDPPFNKVRPDQLFAAVRVLTEGDYGVGLMIAMGPQRASALLGTFAPYGLRPTGFKPTYITVPDEIGIEFHSNLPEGRLFALR